MRIYPALITLLKQKKFSISRKRVSFISNKETWETPAPILDPRTGITKPVQKTNRRQECSDERFPGACFSQTLIVRDRTSYYACPTLGLLLVLSVWPVWPDREHEQQS